MSSHPPEFFNLSVFEVFRFMVTVFPFTVIPLEPDGGGGFGVGSVSGEVGELQAENDIPSAAKSATEPAVLKKSFLDTS